MTGKSEPIDEVKTRVFNAADSIFDESGKVPTVNDVRRLAAVDMHHASKFMKLWRQLHEAKTVMQFEIPDKVKNAMTDAAAVVWMQAQELAANNLKNAESAWAKERQGLEEISTQISEAFEESDKEKEKLSEELQNAQEQIKELITRCDEQNRTNQQLLVDNNELKQRLARQEGMYGELLSQKEELLSLLKLQKNEGS